MPGDGLAFEERDGVANRDGGAGDSRGLRGGFGDRYTAGAQPAAFDKTHYGLGIAGQDRGATLAESDGMAEEKDVRRWGGFLQLRGFVGKDFAGGAVLLRSLEGMSVLELLRMERKGDHVLAERGGVRRQRQKRYFMLARERIWCRAENGDVVFFVHGNDGGSKKLRRAIGAADQDVRLAAVLKSFQHVSDGKHVGFFVNEEAVAEEAVAVASRGSGLI